MRRSKRCERCLMEALESRQMLSSAPVFLNALQAAQMTALVRNCMGQASSFAAPAIMSSVRVVSGMMGVPAGSSGAASVTVSGSSAYTGSTTLSGGTLVLNAGGLTLGSVKTSAGTLQVGGGTTRTGLIGAGSSLDYSFASATPINGATLQTNPPQPVINEQTTITVSNGSTITFAGSSLLNLTEGTISNGSYQLFDYTGATTGINAGTVIFPTTLSAGTITLGTGWATVGSDTYTIDPAATTLVSTDAAS